MGANPFDMGAMAELWLAGSQALMKAQHDAGRVIADGMQALASGTMPAMPGQGGGQSGEYGASGADMAHAQQSVMELWTAATSLFQALSARLPAGGASEAAEATFRSMLDPGAWTALGGGMDDALHRMAQGPRLADLWDMERRTARVMAAWVEVRRAGLEHNAVVLQAWLDAGRAFAEEWAGHTSAENATPDAKAALALWTETANRTLLATQRSEPFLRTQTGMIRATTELRMAQRDLVEHAGRQYGYPTRTELDDVHRSVTEMKRELRAMKRAVRPAAEAPVAAAPELVPDAAPPEVVVAPVARAEVPAMAAATRPRRAARPRSGNAPG